MATLEVGHRFFQQELNNYSDAHTAFFRELVQNSIDADCSFINIKIEQEENSKTAIVKFYDNGIGMTEDVLQNVYLKLGETNKNTNQTIGGFGKARILTCFAHKFYKITTQSCICEGSGASYEIKTNQPYAKGCLLEIHIDTVDRHDHRVDIVQVLKDYLGKCQLSCTVLINGINFSDWLYRLRVARELSIGTVHVNKSSRIKNTLYARVNGVLMYTKYSRAESQVIVEITPEESRDILVSNRDSMKHGHECVLDAFLAEIAIDTKSALRNRCQPYTKRFGNSCFVNKATVLPVQEKQQAAYVAPSNSIAKNELHINFDIKSFNNYELKIADLEPEQPKVENFMIHVDSEKSSIRKAAIAFEPENWTVGGSKKKKLLDLWTVACKAVLEERTKQNPSQINYLTGFVFSDDNVEAVHQTQGDIHCLLVNPLNTNGKFAFSINKRASWIRLITIAIHEITHISESYHDENFASKMTELTVHVFTNLKKIIQKMKMV